jgi:hypothetical protein
MRIQLTKKIRLLTAVSALTLAAGPLAMMVTPASAGTVSHHVSKLHHVNMLKQFPRPGAVSPRVHIATFQVINYNSLLCLGISGDRNDQPAVQWGCNSHADQQWHYGSENSTYPNWFQLVNNNGSCLGVSAGSVAQGARVVGWSCLGSSHLDQYWTPVYSCGAYIALENLKSSYLLGVAGNSTAQGAAVVQWPYQHMCNNQFWVGL